MNPLFPIALSRSFVLWDRNMVSFWAVSVQPLQSLAVTEAMKELKETGLLTLDINGNKVELAEEDLLIETAQTEGYVTETDGDTSVVLDTNLTPELIEEGFVREIISKIQTMRKEAGFEVMDKICIYAKDNERITDL